MPGTLYVVATPIGNLEDVTLRALRILREVSLIAAEDTRRTARLLQHYSISTRDDEPARAQRAQQERRALIARLQAGESIALVSDAGTPVVSDPGTPPGRRGPCGGHPGRAGSRARARPWPRCPPPALRRREFVFVGFPPSRSKARKAWLRAACRRRHGSLILYEAPHRIRATLERYARDSRRPVIAIGRELTKAHEELVVRPISAAA